MVLSNFRFAAGACVLATGLFLGGAGGAIAVATADSHGSNTHSHDGASGSSQGGSPARPVTTPPSGITNTVRETLQGVTATPGSGGPGQKSGLQVFTGVTGVQAQTSPGGANITGPQIDPSPVAVPNPAAPVTKLFAPVTKVFAPVTNVGAPAANVGTQAANGAPAANVGTPAANVGTQAANVGTQAANVGTQLPTAVVPLIDLFPPPPNPPAPVAALTNLAGPLTGVLTDLAAPVTGAFPILAAPVTDLIAVIPSLVLAPITVLQDMVATVAHGVLPFTQLPSEIASLFGITLGLPPAVGPPTTFDYPAAVASAPTALSPASPLPASPLSQPLAPLAPADRPDGPMVGNAAGLVALGGIATSHESRESSLADQAAPTPLGARIEQVLGHVGRAIGEALRSVSLADLAAAALPGLGGLLIFTGAGVRAGHRQAKFGFAVQVAGIARFARTGPLGVVRSDRLVAIHRRKARPQRRLDEAA